MTISSVSDFATRTLEDKAVAERFEYRFDWHPTKATKNAKDHGVTFEQAATVFLDAGLLSQLDEDHGEDEERWLSLGLDKAARRATRPETKAYEESTP